MSNSITLITTGGTIGSTIESDSVNVSQGEQQLRRHIQQVCEHKKISLTTRAAFNKNSEDLTPQDWLTLINSVADEVADGTKNIIITHGTDTMAYSAAAIALCFRDLPVKVVLTGSCFPIDHPNSDVTVNLLGAIATVSEPQIPNGIYVSFVNQAGETQVIDALDIKPMCFDELSFKASFGQYFGSFKSDTDSFEAQPLARQTLPLSMKINFSDINPAKLWANSQRIVQLNCYPGMNAVQMCAGLTAGSCVMINLYHSGTGPSLAGENSLLEAVTSRTDLIFLLSALPSPYITKPYTATLSLMRAGAKVYQDLQPHVLYLLVVLGLSAGIDLDKLLTQLKVHQLALPTH